MGTPTNIFKALKAFHNLEDNGHVKFPKKNITDAEYFEASGTFGAINAARDYVTRLGYATGSMQIDMPIAIAKDVRYISKWDNLGKDLEKIQGVIIPMPEFREGGAAVILFEEKDANY